jgi:Cys-rich repeat protein
VATDPTKPSVRNCSACRTDSDCAGGGKCDLINGRCAAALPVSSSDTSCGATAVNCPASTSGDPKGARPYCLNGEVCVQCRHDADCAGGSYCRSGDCVPCTSDRHCGTSCRDCGIDVSLAQDGTTVTTAKGARPLCLVFGGQVAAAACVGCFVDTDCQGGGTGDMGSRTCDQTTHTCTSGAGCGLTCPSNQICNGTSCVECTAASHCPCGQCENFRCTTQCSSPSDCRSTQCCDSAVKQCYDGVCKPSSGSGCSSCSVGGGQSSTVGPALPSTPGRALLWGLFGALALLSGLRIARRDRRKTGG